MHVRVGGGAYYTLQGDTRVYSVAKGAVLDAHTLRPACPAEAAGPPSEAAWCASGAEGGGDLRLDLAGSDGRGSLLTSVEVLLAQFSSLRCWIPLGLGMPAACGLVVLACAALCSSVRVGGGAYYTLQGDTRVYSVAKGAVLDAHTLRPACPAEAAGPPSEAAWRASMKVPAACGLVVLACAALCSSVRVGGGAYYTLQGDTRVYSVAKGAVLDAHTLRPACPAEAAGPPSEAAWCASGAEGGGDLRLDLAGSDGRGSLLTSVEVLLAQFSSLRCWIPLGLGMPAACGLVVLACAALCSSVRVGGGAYYTLQGDTRVYSVAKGAVLDAHTLRPACPAEAAGPPSEAAWRASMKVPAACGLVVLACAALCSSVRVGGGAYYTLQGDTRVYSVAKGAVLDAHTLRPACPAEAAGPPSEAAWCASGAEGGGDLRLDLAGSDGRGSLLTSVEVLPPCWDSADGSQACAAGYLSARVAYQDALGNWVDLQEDGSPASRTAPRTSPGAQKHSMPRRETAVKGRVLAVKVTPLRWVGQPCLKVVVRVVCPGTGRSEEGAELHLRRLGNLMLGVIFRPSSTSPWELYGYDVATEESVLLYRCGPSVHAYCGGGGGFPVMGSAGGVDFLRPSGTGQVHVLKGLAAGYRVVADFGEHAAWVDVGRADWEGAGGDWTRRGRGHYVAKLACRGEERRRAVYTSFDARFLTDPWALFDGKPPPAEAPGAANATPSAPDHSCSPVGDFSFTVENCFSAETSQWGASLGAHVSRATCGGPHSPALGGGGFPEISVQIDLSSGGGALDFYAAIGGVVVFRAGDAPHGMELWAYSGGAEPPPPPGIPCLELAFTGAEAYHAPLAVGDSVSSLAECFGAPPCDGFEVEFDVFPAELPTDHAVTLIEQPGMDGREGAVLWRVAFGVAGVGLWYAAPECTVDVSIGTSATNSKLIGVSDDIGGCSEFPANHPAPAGLTVGVVRRGVLNVTIADPSGGWPSELVLRCFRIGCAGGSVDVPLRAWTRLKWACEAGRCSVFRAGAVVNTTTWNATAFKADPDTLLRCGSSLSVPDMLPTAGFVGRMRNLRANGQCIVPDIPAVVNKHCPVPVTSDSEGGNASTAAGFADGAELIVGAGGWVMWEWPRTTASVRAVSWGGCGGATAGCCPRALRVQRRRADGTWATVASFTDPAAGGGRRRHEVHGGGSSSAWRFQAVSCTDADGSHSTGAPMAVDFVEFEAECPPATHQGNPPAVQLLADIAPGVDSSNPLAGVALGDRILLFFATKDSSVYYLFGWSPGGGPPWVVSDEHPLRVAPARPQTVPVGTGVGGGVLGVWLVEGGVLVSDGTREGTARHKAPAREGFLGAGEGSVLAEVAPGEVAYACGGGGGGGGDRAICHVRVTAPHEIFVERVLHDDAGGSLLLLQQQQQPGQPFAWYRHQTGEGAAAPPRAGGWPLPTGCAAAVATGVAAAPAAADGRGLTVATGGAVYLTFPAAFDAASLRGKVPRGMAVHLRLFAAGGNGASEALARCSGVSVELLGGDASAAVNGTLPKGGGGALRVDVTPLIDASPEFSAGSRWTFVLRLPGLGDQCGFPTPPGGYFTTFHAPAAADPATAPRLCVAAAAARRLSPLDAPVFERTPPPASKNAVFAASCGAAGVRFRVAAPVLRYLQTGGFDPVSLEGRVMPLLAVEDASGGGRGVVRVLPNCVQLEGGHVTLLSVAPYSVFATTAPHLHPDGCNGVAPGEGVVTEFRYEAGEWGGDGVVEEVCDAAVCVASGGVCSRAGCACGRGQVAVAGACECAAGRYGAGCAARCDDSQCAGRGRCSPSGNCACDVGWGGPRCREAVTCAVLRQLYPGAQSACPHLPSAFPVVAGPPALDVCDACAAEEFVRVACECAAGRCGAGCAARCDDSQCAGRGRCSPSGNCACDVGWGGPRCREAVTCAVLRQLYPGVQSACPHLPSAFPVVAGPPALDVCDACAAEEFETVDGNVRYKCTQG
ncbi:Teneurin-1 [Diplonema papillatum]|nr:Teneurin-1 [Diplonema papillatum]